MSILLDTGWGLSILTLAACALVVGALTVAVTALLALVVYGLRLAGRLTEW